MTNQLAILLGALIVGFSIVGAQFVSRYEVAAATDGSGNSIIWRANSRTGEIELCAFAEPDDPFEKIVPKAGKRYDLKCWQSVGGFRPPKP
jgi:hypothetical protein